MRSAIPVTLYQGYMLSRDITDDTAPGHWLGSDFSCLLSKVALSPFHTVLSKEVTMQKAPMEGVDCFPLLRGRSIH